MDAPYDLQAEAVVKEARRRGARRVLIQLPDGLKQYSGEVYRALAGEGITAFISADPCYGACDLAEGEAEALGADLLVHIGHARFGQGERVPTIYVPARFTGDVRELCSKAAELLRERGVRRVGLVTTVQHEGQLPEFTRALSRIGIEAVVDGETGGVVLGCRTTAAERIESRVDAFLFVGSGEFHALGVALAVGKDVYIADPSKGEVRGEGLKKKALAKRWWAIMEAVKAKAFGVVVVTKFGQQDLDSAAGIGAELKRKGREVFMLAAGDVSWERLAGFTFLDAFVITGCPRIPLDNQELFGKPVLSGEDALELLKRV